jgi:hypothetical protein
VTSDQLSAIRDRVETAHRNPGCCSTRVANDLRALLDEVERLTKREDELVKAGLDLMVANKDLTAERDAAFKRGAEAMRDALVQRVDWHGYMADIIRAEPVPEDR